MRFALLIPKKVEIPAQDVKKIVAHIRRKFEFAEGSDGDAIAVEDIVREAANRGLVEVADNFKPDPDEELYVPDGEIADAIEDESDEG
jgi:hypothetical protein